MACMQVKYSVGYLCPHFINMYVTTALNVTGKFYGN